MKTKHNLIKKEPGRSSSAPSRLVKRKPQGNDEKRTPGRFSKEVVKKNGPQKSKARDGGNYRRSEEGSIDRPREKSGMGVHSVRLNKYIANAGVCSRRDADKLIETGAIKVNGKVVTQLGTKINPGDVVQYDNRTLMGETLRYVLLNKPKGYISTLEDPQDRKTVMMLVQNACKERIYPVGRLDRNTTGLLLLTNDGDLAKKLTHPKHRVRKIYHVELSKALTKNDMQSIADGVELEDGIVIPDAIAYTGTGEDKKKIGIEIHSGKNRVVRRIFEKLGYEVDKLDRVVFSNLTKKDLPRGKWRHLSLTEINILRRIQ